VTGYICSGTRDGVQESGGQEVTHLVEAGTKDLEECKEPVMVWESSRKIRMR
jgi:hypothetical protein